MDNVVVAAEDNVAAEPAGNAVEDSVEEARVDNAAAASEDIRGLDVGRANRVHDLGRRGLGADRDHLDREPGQLLAGEGLLKFAIEPSNSLI